MPQADASYKRIGEILVEKGFLKPEQLAKVLEVQRQSATRLGETLIFLGLVTEDQLAECLAQQMGIPYISIRSHQVSKEILALLPPDVAKRYGVLPLDRIGNILTVAISDGLSVEDIAQLEKRTGCHLKYYFVTLSDFKVAYANLYHGESLIS